MNSQNRPRIAFRADASNQMGIGHIMRCLTLADALRERTAQCTFLCRPHSGHLLELIEQRGHRAVSLQAHHHRPQPLPTEPTHAGWLGTDWKTDAQECIQILSQQPIDWLVVDHYALDRQWEQALRPYCQKLMVIDDLADRMHDCDLLLDPNLGRNSHDYADLLSPCTTTFTGPQYALLRPEFAQLRAQSLARRTRPVLKRLLITMGGVDKDNATGQVLDTLRACPLQPDMRIDIVMGTHAPWLNDVRQKAQKMPCTTEVMVDVKNMAEAMTHSDLAIGAAGGTAWERCCLGLPSLVMVLADNQQMGAEALHTTGGVIAIKELTQIKKIVTEFLSPTGGDTPLHDMVTASAQVCDGKGVERVANHLLPLNLTARAVTPADLMLLFHWANDPVTRQNAFHPSAIPLQDHQAWLTRRLGTPQTCNMYVIEGHEKSIGLVRLDLNGVDEWEIGYSVDPSYRGLGLAKNVLTCGLKQFMQDKLSVQLLAKVKRQNLASCRVFESLNFATEKSTHDMVIYRKKWPSS